MTPLPLKEMLRQMAQSSDPGSEMANVQDQISMLPMRPPALGEKLEADIQKLDDAQSNPEQLKKVAAEIAAKL